MVALEQRDAFERPSRRGIRALAQPGKQAVLFVGGVCRRRLGEVVQRALQSRGIRISQSAAARVTCDGREDVEKRLDPPVAVGEQAERFAERVVRALADPDGHEGSLA